jgi:hypothetical protein
MGGTITRDEWLKLQESDRERAMAPRGPCNVVVPLALQNTEEERLGQWERVGVCAE